MDTQKYEFSELANASKVPRGRARTATAFLEPEPTVFALEELASLEP